MSNKTVRVAITQYHVGNDIQANLAKLLDYIEQAAAGGAQLVVAPEFGNHSSFYIDVDQAWDVAIERDGPYVKAVQEKAKQCGIHVVFNATSRGEQKPTAYITNFLIGPDGEMIGYDYKQVLMSGEATFLSASPIPGRVYDTAIGRIGMMSCLDGVPPETARNLALLGAQIITNAHNSCALDEPYEHIPARAAENHIWMLPSGKSGYICMPEQVEMIAQMLDAPGHIAKAHGENPILDPQGKAIARLPCLEEGIVFADIEPAAADNKQWADGDLFADRRPALYQAMAEPAITPEDGVSAAVEAAVIQVHSDRPVEVNSYRALDLLADAAENGAQLVVLPELVIFDREAIAADPALAAQQSQVFERQLGESCQQYGVHAVASIVTAEDDRYFHSAILLDDSGKRIGHYHQTHLPHSYRRWATAGDQLPVFETRLGRIGLLLGYDMVFIEPATVLARKGAEIIAHPTNWNFDWELDLIVPERAAENRVSILSAARADSQVQRGGMINALAKSRPLRASDLNPIWPVEVPPWS